ncbi:MAG: dihydroneopterin aldolase [Verrucomicrobia bacterium]|nr:dihydroneopterin aldolase [Verrucomicrobiota bacterium]
MDTIVIQDLEVFYRVGVPDDERAKPQRLLLRLELGGEFSAAAKTDELNRTIDYHAVSTRLLKFGEGREWKLIEKLAVDIAEMLLAEFHPSTVAAEVKKFILPKAQYVSVRVTRSKPTPSDYRHQAEGIR